MKKILSQCKVIASLLIFLFLFSAAHSATITSRATGGVWTAGSTWTGGVVPASSDAVIIATTGANTVQITGSLAQTSTGSVTINTGAVLTTSISNGTITIGSLTINSGGTAIIYRRLTVLGATNISGTIRFGSTNTTVWNMTFTGAVTLNSGASWNETTAGAAATFTFRNNFTNNASTFTAQNTAHTFSGAAMTISGSTSIVMPQATFSGTYTNTGTLTIATATFTGNFTNTGTIACSTLLRVTGRGISLSNSGIISATAALSGTGAVTNSATGLLNIGGSSSITTLTNTGTTNITGPGAITTGFRNFTNTGTINLTGTGAISGITNNAGGIINLSSSGTITRFNNAAASSKINISAAPVPAITTLTATAIGNIVNYTGTGQSLKVAAYHHLILSGGAKTFGAITTVGGNLTLSGSATATTGAGLTVAGNLFIGDGTTFTAAAYNLTVTGTTTVGGGASGNLTISSVTGTKRFTGLVTIASGATWNNSANSAIEFRGGITTMPAFIGGTGVHTFTTNAQALTGIFTIPSIRATGITLTNNNTLTVGTALAGTGGLNNTTTGTLNIGGVNGTCSITTLSNLGIATFSGSGAITTTVASFTNTGTLNLNGSGPIAGITNDAGGIINLASSGTINTLNNATSTSTINISAATVPAITTLTATVAGNTVNYIGVAQNACKATTYSNLILSGSGIKQFPSTPSVNGKLSLEGTASVIITTGAGVVTYGAAATLQYNKPAAYQATTKEWITPFIATGGIVIKNTGAITTPGAVQIGNNTNVPLNIYAGATLIQGANLLTLHGDFTNAGTLTSGSGGVVIAGTTASSLSGSGGTVMNNLTIAKASGAVVTTTLGLLTTNKVTVTSGTFANNGVISLSGDFINTGTYSGTGTITLSGTTSATLSGNGTSDMYNLSIAKSGGASVTTTLGLLTTNDLTITTGKFTIDPLKYVTVNGALTLNDSIILKSTSTGTASLVTKGAVTGSKARVERYIGGASWGWHYLSSPVISQAISGGFTPSGASLDYDFYTWYEPSLTWVNFKNTGTPPTWNTANGSTNFVPGRGYLVAYQAINTTKSFIGTLNNVSVSIPLTYSGVSTYQYFNFVGNPYPCSIDWDAATGWNKASLNGTYKGYWIWNDAAGNWGSYINGIGSVGATQYITSGEGFLVLAASAGNLVMSDGVKAHSTQAFFKSSKSANEELKLKLSCDANTYLDEVIIAFNSNMPEGGSEKYNSMYPDAPELWSVKNGNNYSINFFGDISTDKTVPLTLKAGVSGTYALTASQVESFADNSSVSLEDRLTGTFTDLSSTPSYTFKVSSPATIADRFFLHFMDVTGIAIPEATRNFNMYTTDGVLNIQSLQLLGGKVTIVDMLGRIVAKGRVEPGATTRIDMHGNTGVYIVSVLTSKGINNTKIMVK